MCTFNLEDVTDMNVEKEDNSFNCTKRPLHILKSKSRELLINMDLIMTYYPRIIVTPNP